MAPWCCKNSSVISGGKMTMLIVVLLLHFAVVSSQDGDKNPPGQDANQGQAPEAQAEGNEPEKNDLPKGVTIPGTGGTGFTGKRSKLKVEHTPLPDWEVEELKKLESATYSPMEKEFQYINDQYYEVYQSKKFPRNRPWKSQRGHEDVYHETERCYDDYLKCILSAPFRTPVCALWRSNEQYGYWETNSYCDVYFENCRLRQRSWRILDNGYCHFERPGQLKEIYITRRRNLPPWKVFIKQMP